MNGLPVGDQRLTLLRFSGTNIATQSASFKYGLSQLGAHAPLADVGVDGAREYLTSADSTAAVSSQRNLREESGLGEADLRVGGN